MAFAWLHMRPHLRGLSQVLVMILVEYIEDLSGHVILRGIISVLGV